jgi:hypothetical protein
MGDGGNEEMKEEENEGMRDGESTLRLSLFSPSFSFA